MATAGVAGRIGFLGVIATSSGTHGEVAEIRNFNLTIDQAQIDASSNDSSGWNEFLAGQRGATLTAEAVYARTDAEQVMIREALSSGVIRNWLLRPTTSASALWRFNGYVENYSISGSYDNITVTNFSVRASRAVTYTT